MSGDTSTDGCERHFGDNVNDSRNTNGFSNGCHSCSCYH